MNTEKIHNHLNKLLANPNSKNFLNHLIRSYIPLSNTEKVMEIQKQDMECCITKKPLESVNEILSTLKTEEAKKEFFSDMGNMFENNNETCITNLTNLKLGLKGKNTDTYISCIALQELYNWVINKVAESDKHIIWLLGKENRTFFINKANPNKVVEPIKKDETKKKNQLIKSTYTLGDLNVLQELRKKFDN